MANNEINISVQTQQQNINATPSVQQNNIDVNYTFENVLWGRILGNINNQSDLITLFGTKQDTISDLETIRSGASLGSTSVQPADLATVATTGNYEDLLNKPTIPTDTDDLTNGAGYQTAEDVSDAISTKANVDLSNLSSAGENHFLQMPSGKTQADVDFVVESYLNGTSWYRVYKSGWCEQGGYLSTAANTTYSQSFLKEFTDTNYSIQLTQFGVMSNYNANPLVLTKTASSFEFVGQETGTFWEAKGYIA